MSVTSEPTTCSKCGGPIPAEAPEGLCPKCLLLGVSMPTEAGKRRADQGDPTHARGIGGGLSEPGNSRIHRPGRHGLCVQGPAAEARPLGGAEDSPQTLAADPAFAERFIREGRMLARLNHPEIVAVHDFGQANGFFYLLMEFVDGVNLRQAMKAGRFEPAQALAIVPQDLRGAAICAQRRGAASRHQAGEHPARHERAGEDCRLWDREAGGRAARRGHADRQRRGAGHAPLHGARTDRDIRRTWTIAPTSIPSASSFTKC